MNHIDRAEKCAERPSNGWDHWGKLSDDELDVVEGRRDLLVNKLQARFGISKEEADRRYREFETRGYWDEARCAVPAGKP